MPMSPRSYKTCPLPLPWWFKGGQVHNKDRVLGGAGATPSPLVGEGWGEGGIFTVALSKNPYLNGIGVGVRGNAEITTIL
jgi:hypothetical protein